MNDFDGIMRNPLFQMGLGILANNTPGATFGQAVGGGAITGIQNFQQMQALKEQSEERKLQAEFTRQRIEQAKKDADVQMEMQRRAEEWVAANPQYEPLYRMGGMEALSQQMLAEMKPQTPKSYEPPNSYQEFLLAQKDPAYAAMLAEKRKNQGRMTLEFPGMNKPVVTGLQQSQLSASGSLGEARELLSRVEQAPGMVGAIPSLKEKAAGWLGQIGEGLGVAPASWLADTIRPVAEIMDLDGNIVETSPTDIAARSLALKARAREIMAPDKGPLTNQEQNDYKEALAMLDSADAKTKAKGMRTMIDLMENRLRFIEQNLQMSGEYIPGQARTGQPTATPELLQQAIDVLMQGQ